MRKRLPLTIVAGLALNFLAIVLVGTYTFLPPLAEMVVARTVQEGLGLGERPEVELQSDPPLAMLAGKFLGGRILLRDADLGDVRAGRVVVNLDPFDLDVAGSVMAGALRREDPLSGTLRAEISEQEISQLMQADVQDIELEEDRVLVISDAQVLGFDVPVSVQGRLVLRGGGLVFEPQRALGTPVLERLLAGVSFSYLLGRLPYGVEITGVEVAENRLVLSGEMKHISLNRSGG